MSIRTRVCWAWLLIVALTVQLTLVGGHVHTHGSHIAEPVSRGQLVSFLAHHRDRAHPPHHAHLAGEGDRHHHHHPTRHAHLPAGGSGAADPPPAHGGDPAGQDCALCSALSALAALVLPALALSGLETSAGSAIAIAHGGGPAAGDRARSYHARGPPHSRAA